MWLLKLTKLSYICLISSMALLVPPCRGEDDQTVKDKAALLTFMQGVSLDPNGILQNWNSSSNVHVCNWSGVRCNNVTGRVVELDLSGMSLRGIISPSLSGLIFLRILDLSKNLFHGLIPPELGFLSGLKQLSLSSNVLEGTIPKEFGSLQKLVYLDLGSNKLTGDIPMQLFCNGSSLSLEYIDLSNNSISGEIPIKSQCQLKELRFLLLWSNKLVGKIPQALSNSTKLEWVDLESNLLSGELSFQILYTIPELQFLYLSYNNFVSHDFNTNLEPFFVSLVNNSKLQELELAGNNLGGKLPPIIGDLSARLVQIHLDDNLIYGSIPPQISNLDNLTLLNLSSNLLNGSIPPEIYRMRRLERVYLSNNSLSGEIPSAFGSISHLGLLDLSKNNLSGSIPDSFANLPQLRRLLLFENQLSGTIPPSLGNCTNLEILDLSHNAIVGTIPREVAGLRSLKLYLNLSSNHLEGPIPLELSKMDMVLAIDLSSNNLSGTIPSQIESCIALEYLNLSHNSFEGLLPSSAGKLPYLQALDVSANKLSGKIPVTLQASSTLKNLNFSFNYFSGNISATGAFSSLTSDSFLGNKGICGSVKGMPNCQKKRSIHIILWPILLALFATPVVCFFGFKSRIERPMTIFSPGETKDEENGRKEQKYPRITYRELIEATGGFSRSNLIGSGQFGEVYKGTLRDNTKVAIKVLNTKSAGETSGSFKRECQVLKRTRHRNLIKIITICSKPDFKALVLPLMSNGSLERHLYPSQELGKQYVELDLVKLVSICCDVAEGVAYLHHHSPVRVVHCDLKPSNILLDDDFTALVSDFGISRLVKGIDEKNNNFVNDSANSFNSTDGLLCGSIGYIAPEYGMGRRASTQGDVYSFGVLVLEILIGKRPTDVLVNQCSTFPEWVKSHYPHRLDPIIDNVLALYGHAGIEEHQSKLFRDIVLELIELGLVCTQFNPCTRPTMLDVSIEMNRMKQCIVNPSKAKVSKALWCKDQASPPFSERESPLRERIGFFTSSTEQSRKF